MERYLIQNDPNQFGFIVELKIEQFVTEFKIYKVTGEKETQGVQTQIVEPVVNGTLKWDGCSDLYFGEDGNIHFCETNDLICLNKSLKLVWDSARNQYVYDANVEPWQVKDEGIKKFEGEFKLEDG